MKSMTSRILTTWLLNSFSINFFLIMLESEQILTDQEEFCYVICKLYSPIKDSKYCSKVKSKNNILLLFDKLCTDL
jgi:hypothetical protein